MFILNNNDMLDLSVEMLCGRHSNVGVTTCFQGEIKTEITKELLLKLVFI